MENQMNYCYEMTLSMVSPGDPFGEEEQTTLAQAVETYNARSVYMGNPKAIELEEMTESCISLKLFSTQALSTPGRGLRLLTTLLLESPSSCFKKRVTPSGQLFRVIAIKKPTEEAAQNPAAISDMELIKALLDYYDAKKDSSSAAKKKRAAMEEIKRIAVSVGMVP